MLTRTQEGALRLLLDDPRIDLDDIDWAGLREVGAYSGVLVRLADAVHARGETLPPLFAAAAARACAGAQRALEIADRLSDRCQALGLAHSFLHAAQRYPDSGHVTLLIGAPNAPAVDRQLLADLPATFRRPRPRRGFERWLGGASAYVTAHGIGLRIRHGRLGRFGEHARYARLLIGRSRAVSVGQITCLAPTPEDHLLLLVIERTYTRPAFRLGDLAWAIPVMRTGSLNWDYLFATALSIGMLAGVGAYIEYVNGIHRQLCARDVVDPAIRVRFRTARAARRDTPRDTSRFPTPAAGAMARAYLGHVSETLDSGRWYSAARLSLLPLVAALAQGRRS